ncbi:hypothetical protein RHSIM_Rhsim01G0238900 [Rhododendron simsii]|uniref:Uncharacterized protein n=1 Tax=Rhododendron simsii TaxID=118357 RepID=A0A834LXE4_RHOSS|nr:hypothetical protein RHSIM_Rhsim01G0238900 [Rhododendron simsii]
MLKIKHCFALETAVDGPEQGDNASEQTGPELLPEHPNNDATATTVGNPQEAPPTQLSTTAILTLTTHQTLTTLLRPPPKTAGLGENPDQHRPDLEEPKLKDYRIDTGKLRPEKKKKKKRNPPRPNHTPYYHDDSPEYSRSGTVVRAIGLWDTTSHRTEPS